MRKRCDLLLAHAPAGRLERTGSQAGAWELVGRFPRGLVGASRLLRRGPRARIAGATKLPGRTPARKFGLHNEAIRRVESVPRTETLRNEAAT
jgi:hypothetical protein